MHKIVDVTRVSPLEVEVSVEGDVWPKAYTIGVDCDDADEADAKEAEFIMRIGEPLDS